MTQPRCDDPVVIIGAGIGGLAAAIDLAANGVPVRICESAATPGGKMRTLSAGGTPIDAGPTVLTMRRGFEALFADAGASLDDHVTLVPAERLARHAWNDRETFDLFADLERSIDAVGTFAGARQASEFRRFLADSAKLFATLETTFLTASKPSPFSLTARILMQNPAGLLSMRPFASLWRVLGEYFPDPRLRQLYGRYATYCGASPFHAPATLMMIPALEHQGVWLVEGGMIRLAEAMARLAVSLGVKLSLDAKVARIEVANGRAGAVTLDSGERIPARAVLANADPEAVRGGLFGVEGALPEQTLQTPSLSAMVWTAHAKTSGFALDRHNVFFSTDYRAEFHALFEERRLAEEPTLYVCAQDRGHRAPVSGPERLLILMNAPADGACHVYSDEETERWQSRIGERLSSYGLTVDINEVQVTTPNGFDALFPGTGGAIYGQALHGWRAAFQRPGAHTRCKGLYLAGGAIHPGPGVPTSMLSGRIAARAILTDLASTPRFRPVGIDGSTPMRSARTGASASS